jgi:hypothetical protein
MGGHAAGVSAVFGADLVAAVAIFGFVTLAMIVKAEMVMLLAIHVEHVDFSDIAARMIPIKMLAHVWRQVIDSHDRDLIIVVVVMMVMMDAATEKAQCDGQREDS